jgi:hypothetical protein
MLPFLPFFLLVLLCGSCMIDNGPGERPAVVVARLIYASGNESAMTVVMAPSWHWPVWSSPRNRGVVQP